MDMSLFHFLAGKFLQKTVKHDNYFCVHLSLNLAGQTPLVKIPSHWKAVTARWEIWSNVLDKTHIPADNRHGQDETANYQQWRKNVNKLQYV